MKYILMNSEGKFQKEKKKKRKEKKNTEEEKELNKECANVNIDVDSKEVDIAEYTIKNDEISKEIKKRTDDKLREYLDPTSTEPLTYTKFEKDMGAVVTGILNDPNVKKRQNSHKKRMEQLQALKNKLFNRRKNG